MWKIGKGLTRLRTSLCSIAEIHGIALIASYTLPSSISFTVLVILCDSFILTFFQQTLLYFFLSSRVLNVCCGFPRFWGKRVKILWEDCDGWQWWWWWGGGSMKIMRDDDDVCIKSKKVQEDWFKLSRWDYLYKHYSLWIELRISYEPFFHINKYVISIFALMWGWWDWSWPDNVLGFVKYVALFKAKRWTAHLDFAWNWLRESGRETNIICSNTFASACSSQRQTLSTLFSAFSGDEIEFIDKRKNDMLNSVLIDVP